MANQGKENSTPIDSARVKDSLKAAIEQELLRMPTIESLQTEGAGPSKFSQVSHIQDAARLIDEGLAATGDDIDEKVKEFAERLVALRG